MPNLVVIGTAVWHLYHIFEFVTPDPLQMADGARGVNFLAYVNSLLNLYTCAKFGPDRSSGLEAFPDL